MPAGLEVTGPRPRPDLTTVSVNFCGGGGWVNVAVTSTASIMVTVQSPVPEQPPPLQPAKVEPMPADAVSVTTEPTSKPAKQVRPQSIPTGSKVTVPLP